MFAVFRTFNADRWMVMRVHADLMNVVVVSEFRDRRSDNEKLTAKLVRAD